MRAGSAVPPSPFVPMPRASTIRRSRVALAIAAAIGVANAHGNSILVTDGGDNGTSSTCTFRQAVDAANSDLAQTNVSSCAQGGGADTINFAADLAGATILLGGDGELSVAAGLTINGSGQIVTGNGSARVLSVSGTTLTLSKMILRAGNTDSSGGDILEENSVVSLNDVTISDGSSGDGGGGLFAYGGRVTVTNSTISGNTTGSGGGAGFFSAHGAVSIITNTTITGNSIGFPGVGGGLRIVGGSSMQVKGSYVTGNYAFFMGGGVLVSDSTLTMFASTVAGNSVNEIGGYGGGIAVVGPAIARLDYSTISGNSGSVGSGVFVRKGTILTANTTLYGNSAYIYGGGLYVGSNDAQAPSSVSLVNSTISGNSARSGGGLWQLGYVTVSLNNTIMNNDCRFSGGELSADHSMITSLCNSFLDNNSDGTSNIIDGDPRLGPLAENGGPTKTMALLPGSGAIDAGSDTLASGLTYDQRGPGYPRVYNGTVDIGAYELGDTIFVNDFDPFP